jgi:hypothetical protein
MEVIAWAKVDIEGGFLFGIAGSRSPLLLPVFTILSFK